MTEASAVDLPSRIAPGVDPGQGAAVVDRRQLLIEDWQRYWRHGHTPPGLVRP